MSTPGNRDVAAGTPATSLAPVRIAAFGDLHWGSHLDESWLAELVAEAALAADILVLLGDLTTHGEPEQVAEVGRAFGKADIPMLTVLGNHDFESGRTDEIKKILADHGIRVLDGDSVVIDGIGFAGVKGFGGGFGRHALETFGEPDTKAFVESAIQEELKLARALAALETESKVVLLHYSPLIGTLGEEPPPIWPFLGSSRLLNPIETHGANVVFHGHAHLGAPEASTPSGIPVFNVALPVLEKAGLRFRLWDAQQTVSVR